MMDDKISREERVREVEEESVAMSELSEIEKLMLKKIDNWLTKDTRLMKRIYLLIKNLKE